MDKDQAIKQLFDVFYLDNRASQTELEIAYETLTSQPNVPNSVMHDYRIAFETLMLEWFGVGKDETELSDKIKEVDKIEPSIKNIVNVLPDKVREGFESICASTKEELTEEVKRKILEQNVNLPLLFYEVKKTYKRDWKNKPYWDEGAMMQILNSIQLNSVDFRKLQFSIYYGQEDYSWKYKDLKKWVHNQQKLFLDYGDLCPRFDVLDFQKGCTGAVIIEHELGKSLMDILQGYSLQLDLNFCASGDIQINS